MVDENERRQGERRSGDERRAPSRTDPLPRRAQLRRQADVLAHLSGALEKEPGRAPKISCLDATILRF